MRATKNQIIIGIISIAILLVSLVITLCDALIPLNIWVHPVLTFLFCIFIGFGVMSFVFGILKQFPMYYFISAMLLGLAFIYAFAASLPNYWWISLIVAVVVWAVIGIISFLSAGNQTEEISLNKASDYKNYEQRKAEKEQVEKDRELEPLPEIKSFKDDN